LIEENLKDVPFIPVNLEFQYPILDA